MIASARDGHHHSVAADTAASVFGHSFEKKGGGEVKLEEGTRPSCNALPV